MAGGTWNSQNKPLPGVYINVQSRESVNISVGERGTVAIAKALSWGPAGEVMTILPGEALEPYIGYDITNTNALFLREMMKGSDATSGPSKILLYRLPGTDGAKASASIGDLTVTALYDGVRGNDITIVITADPDAAGAYDVNTVVDGYIVDSQSITDLSQLQANAWVTFTGTGTGITASVGTPLTGGADPEISAADYAAYLTAIEPYQFDILAYDGEESTVIEAMVQFIKRLNESVGRKCQMVAAGSVAAANSNYVIAVQNGVVLGDGTQLTAQQAVWWLAGAEAGALYNQSLTYAQYPGAVAANPKLSDVQAAAAVEAGMICFIDTFDVVKVCTDIDTLTTITPKKGAEFKKNRVMRVINQFCNDVYEHFSNYFIGKVDNNDAGRALLRAWIIGYLNEMQANNGIQNFTAEDVTVEPGQAIDAVLVNVVIMPVDAIEKIYMTVTVTTAGAVTVETTT